MSKPGVGGDHQILDTLEQGERVKHITVDDINNDTTNNNNRNRDENLFKFKICYLVFGIVMIICAIVLLLFYEKSCSAPSGQISCNYINATWSPPVWSVFINGPASCGDIFQTSTTDDFNPQKDNCYLNDCKWSNGSNDDNCSQVLLAFGIICLVLIPIPFCCFLLCGCLECFAKFAGRGSSL